MTGRAGTNGALPPTRFRVVSLDFDHTLTVGVSAMEHVARLHRIEAEIAAAEAGFRAGELTTAEFTDTTASLLAGLRLDHLAEHMRGIPLVEGCSDLVTELKRRGLRVILNTVGYRPFLLPVAESLGVDAVSGVEMEEVEGALSGRITGYFPLDAKIGFAEREAQVAGGTLDEVIAVGDGLSDLPLFAAVGASVAFNADPQTEARATKVARGWDCSDLRARLDELIAPPG